MLVSMCCKKDLYAVHTENGGGHYMCRHCGKPCSPLLINEYTPLAHIQDDTDADV